MHHPNFISDFESVTMPQPLRTDSAISPEYVGARADYFNRVVASLHLSGWAIDRFIIPRSRDYFEDGLLAIHRDEIRLRGGAVLASSVTIYDDAMTGEQEPGYVIDFTKGTLTEPSVRVLTSLHEADSHITSAVFKGLVE